MKQKQIHKTITTYARDEVKQAAFDHLETLLTKVSMSAAARELNLYVPTLHRILDENLPIESISYMTACYIVFMCETTDRIKRILNEAPSNTAYYSHVRHDRLAARETGEQNNVASN